MLPYTPTPNPLPSELSLPQDAIDDVVVATVNPWAQQIADAIALREMISLQVAQYTVVGDTYTTGQRLVLTPDFEGPGIAWDGGTKQIDITDGGMWFATGAILGESDSALAGALVSLDLVAIGSTVSPTLAYIYSFRVGTDITEPMLLRGSGMGQVNDGCAMSITHTGSDPFNVETNARNKITIMRINANVP